jgi:signal transduction histidine kinase
MRHGTYENRTVNPQSNRLLGKGMGQGIALVYGIVKQHKGFIDEPGKGTAFRIPFPLTTAPDQSWRRT